MAYAGKPYKRVKAHNGVEYTLERNDCSGGIGAETHRTTCEGLTSPWYSKMKHATEFAVWAINSQHWANE